MPYQENEINLLKDLLLNLIPEAGETKGNVTLRDEFIAAAKANPDKLAYGSNGNGTAQHMIGTQFQIETGAQILGREARGNDGDGTGRLHEAVPDSIEDPSPRCFIGLPFCSRFRACRLSNGAHWILCRTGRRRRRRGIWHKKEIVFLWRA